MAHERILVVDDSPLVLNIVSEFLENNGFTTLAANNGVEAIEKTFKEQPDLIILDVLMPRMNGYQVCRLLKSDPETLHIPVIILTVKDQTYDKYWGDQVGADGYLSKKFEQTVLLEMIKKLIQKNQKTTSTRSFIRENSLFSAVDIISKMNSLLDRKLFEATVLNEMSSLIEKGVGDFKSTVDIVMNTLAMIVGYNVGVIVTMEEQHATCFITINHPVSERYLKEVEVHVKNYLKKYNIYYFENAVTRFNTDKIKKADDIKGQRISFFDVPVRHANRLGGLIILAQDISEKIENKETEFFKTATRQAYIVIENSWLYNKVKRLAITDSLTGNYNHGFLYESLYKEFARSERNYLPLSLLLLDVDYFKKINDTYGHREGDSILYKLSQIFKNYIRSYDILGRYGGEEFMIILPETEKNNGVKFAERIRKAVEEYNFGDDNKIIKCTISVGVSNYPNNETKNTEDLIIKADKALYRAKAEGRNRVCT